MENNIFLKKWKDAPKRSKRKKILKKKSFFKKKQSKVCFRIENAIKIVLLFLLFLLLIKKNYHKIYIAINIDDKYFYPSLVFITSLLENRNSTTVYYLYILADKNIILDHKNKTDILRNKYGKYLDIKYINMKNDFEGALSGKYISTAAYYRIALPSLLPKISRIIYCDSDILNFKDLTEMYTLNLPDNIYMKGILDHISLLDEIDIPKIRYMNSGVLLMNLKSMRLNNVEQKIRNYITRHFLNHHDQTAINGICYNNWDVLSLKYSTFSFDDYSKLVEYNNKQNKKYQYSQEELRFAFYEPTLLHFPGFVKPWEHEYKRKNDKYWWYYVKKSPFYDEILEKYKFSKDEVEKKLEKIPKDGGFIHNYNKKTNLFSALFN